MASTVKAQLDVANPGNLPDLARLAKLGSGLALMPRFEKVAVSGNIGTLTLKAAVLLSVRATAGGAVGELDIIKKEGAIIAGDCTINALGNVAFAAADAVTAAEIIYIPIQAQLYTETIQVTAGGVGTFNNSRSCHQIVSASLVAPAVTPGAKTAVARGTLVGALGAGECAVQDGGTTIQFVAAEAGVACTATVSYYAYPGVGTGPDPDFGERLEASFTP